MNPLREAMPAESLVDRCRLFGMSGLPVWWLFQMRTAVASNMTENHEALKTIQAVCRECPHRIQCYDDPDLAGSRKELTNSYQRLRHKRKTAQSD